MNWALHFQRAQSAEASSPSRPDKAPIAVVGSASQVSRPQAHCDDAAFNRLVSQFRRRFPACEVATLDVIGSDCHETLRSGAIDVLLGRFAGPPPSGLAQGPVMAQESWVLGVARDHPLAGSEVVSVEELADYAIFGVPHGVTGELYNPFYPSHTPKGRPIPRRGIARTCAEVLTLVAQQESVIPVGESFPSHYGHPNVVFVPLQGWPPATRTLVWRTERNSARVSAFIDAATASQPTPRSRLGTPGYGDWPGPRNLG